jgi:hypothetical protein
MLLFISYVSIRICNSIFLYRYNRFERDKVVSFVPPDGQFELMRYRPTVTSTILVPPIFCQPQISLDAQSTQGHISVTVGGRSDTTLIIPNRAKGGPLVVRTFTININLSFLLCELIFGTAGRCHCHNSIYSSCQNGEFDRFHRNMPLRRSDKGRLFNSIFKFIFNSFVSR